MLLKFYITPQLIQHDPVSGFRCILLEFYIKPQHTLYATGWNRVVSYWNSTSNHNDRLYNVNLALVVSYWNSTSNHNADMRGLYSICCILLKFYIKPQHGGEYDATLRRCILLKFYIKPQLRRMPSVSLSSCILLKLYIKPQHYKSKLASTASCILLKFYIKPQQQTSGICHTLVVSYWNSTSNHNKLCLEYFFVPLYLIEILHQTTTHSLRTCSRPCCILLKFYIKPQLRRPFRVLSAVVSYWNSTSNHNVKGIQADFI